MKKPVYLDDADFKLFLSLLVEMGLKNGGLSGVWESFYFRKYGS
ncbi:MAG: hypothetical protein ACU83U_15295 [Gammaproteobacteria bacterium]